MEEVAGVKENVNPRGGLLAPSSRRERRLKLGAGAQEPRIRERVGVLAPNSTLGNGGGVDPLEWLKGRLSQHQSVSNSQLELDSGSRHLRKFGSSPAENGELLGGLGKPSAGLASKKMGGMAAGREQSSSFLSHHSPSHSRASILHSHSHNAVDNAERTTKNNRSSTGVHVGGAKSPWPVSVYQDDSINFQVQRGSSRREANAKAVEVKSPGAAHLIAKGLALKSEIEEHSKVGLNPSPSGTFLSKSQLQQDQVCVKQLSPQQSHSTGSGLWNGSKRQGTPYKRKVQKSDNSVVDQPESNTDQEHSGSGKAVGLRQIESERAKSSVTSPGRREVSRREVMVEAVEEKSPAADTRTGSASKSEIDDKGNQRFSSKCEEIKSRIEQLAADTVTRSASRSHINENGNQSFPTKCEDIKSRIEQHKIKLKQLYSRKPSSSAESGRSSFRNVQGPLCNYTPPMPEKEEVASSPDVKISQCRERKLQETVLEDEKDGMDFSVNLPYVSPELHLREVYHHELGQKIDCGSRAVPCENISKYASGYSEDSANKVSLRRESSPSPAKIQSASTVIAGSSNRKWSGSGAEHLPLYYGLKQNTNNMDVTAVGNDSALLSAEVTAASSSGSSSTPCVMGNSSLDDVTMKSHENVLPTPSAEKALSSSYRLSAVQKLSRINKRSGSLGPPSRVLRDEAESSNNGISPVSVALITGSDCSAVMEAEVGKNCRQLEHPSSDPRKRKAERDLSGGDGDTSQILEQSCSAPASAQDKVTERAVQAQRKSSGEPRDVNSMHKERPSRLIRKEDAGEFAHPRMPSKLVERAMDLLPRISATGRLEHSDQPSFVLVTSRTTTAAAAAYAGRQSRSTPAQKQNGIDASGAPSDSCKKRDGKPVPIRDGAELKLSTMGKAGLSVISPIIEPADEIQNADVVQAGGQPDEGIEKRVPATANVEVERELAVDMSHDGFLSGENKENFVPDLPNGLNSLSLEGEHMLKKDESKLSSNISNRISLIPSDSHSSQLNTLKSVENCHAPHSTSHSARSGVSIEMGSRAQVQIPGKLQSNESAEKPTPSASLLSENPLCELSRNGAGPSKEYHTEVKATTVRSERAENSGANPQAQQSSHGTEKVNGQGASAAQSKISENSHFVWVNDKRYQKIGKIGKGGSSEVYKVIDSDCNIYAMKKINLKGRDHRAAIGFYQEIEYLEKLRGKRNVIQLIHYEVTNRTVVREDYEEEKILEDAYIYMVLEFGEIDLAGILSKKRKEMMENNEIIDDNWLRFYWKHMLLAVKTIHDERIVHADLKPANFLLVQGELKLIDFGIAKAIQSDTTHIVRDSNNMVGTVNYMSPEALMTNSLDDKGEMVKCGRASDIWSLGCILYQMVYGHTPFSQVTSFYAKIQAITSKNHRIEFPAIPDPWLQDVMKKCLIWDRHSRPQITDLLEHPFLRPGLANHQK